MGRMSRPSPESESDVRQYFDERAGKYRDRIYLSGERNCLYHNQQRRQLHFRRLLMKLRERSPGPGRALDIGSGPGAIAHELRSCGYRTCGVDLAFKMLLQNRENNGDAVALAQCSADSLCYQNQSLDVVTAAGTLEYVPDDTKALGEMLRVLKPGGTLIISVPIGEWSFFSWLRRLLLKRVLRRDLPQVYHKTYAPVAFMRQLEQAGFRPVGTISHQFVFFPLDFLLPRLSARLDNALTRRFGTNSRISTLGRSFIVEATAPGLPGGVQRDLRTS